MKRRGAVGVLLAALVVGCGPAEVRLDETKGIPAVKGTADVQLDTLACGQPITSGPYTVSTRAVAGGCELSFDQDVEVLKASDYNSLPELQGASSLVQRVELTIKKLAFADATTGQPLDATTRITSATLSVNGQPVADKAALAALPKTVTLAGAALDPIKAKVEARQPATVRARCVVVVPDSPAPPAKLRIEYEAQPAIILGPGKIL